MQALFPVGQVVATPALSGSWRQPRFRRSHCCIAMSVEIGVISARKTVSRTS